MQTIRIKTPQVYRVTRAVPVYHQPARTMSLFPRFAAGEFAPLFRLLDDYATHQLTRPSFSVPALRTFQPRFDVREAKDSYELHGELPGIDQKDIAIEFTDESTLSIRGRTERHEERGQPQPQAAVEAQPEQPKLTDSGYHKATVEDETAMAMSGANPDAVDTSTPSDAQSVKTPSESQTSQVEAQTQQQQQQPQSRYWVSERSVGEFSRTFNFPSRVDQENVKASLRNGILSIVVPKAQAPASRRINIE